MRFIKKFLRWIRFHFYFKRKFSSSPGIPTLCSNLRHPYHESKFELSTCEVLSKFFEDNSKNLVKISENGYDLGDGSVIGADDGCDAVDGLLESKG